MNFRWIREITPVKLLSLLLEVGLDQGNLRAVRWVFDRDRLQTAIFEGLEMMHGLFKIERHELGTLGGDLLLTAWRRTEANTLEETEHGYNSQNYGRNDGSAVVIFRPKMLIHRHPHAPSAYLSSSWPLHSDTL